MKDTPTFNVNGQMSNLMMVSLIFLNYPDLVSPVVDVHIDGIIAPHT